MRKVHEGLLCSSGIACSTPTSGWVDGERLPAPGASTRDGSDKALATFEHGLGFYIVGSLVWSAVIGLIGMVVSLKAYRKE